MLYERYSQLLGTVEDPFVCGAVTEEIVEAAETGQFPITEVVEAIERVWSHLDGPGSELFPEPTYARLDRWFAEVWRTATPPEAVALLRLLHPLVMPRARGAVEAFRSQLPPEAWERFREMVARWEGDYMQISHLTGELHRHSRLLWAYLHTRSGYAFATGTLLDAHFAVTKLSFSVRTFLMRDESARDYDFPTRPERFALVAPLRELAAQDPAFTESEVGRKTLSLADSYLSVLDRYA